MLGTFAVVLALIVPFSISCSASEGDGADPERTTSEQPGTPETEPESPPPDPVQRLSHEIWISEEELLELPTSGPAWDLVVEAADEDLDSADIADKDSDHDVMTMAVGLVYARTGDPDYRRKAAKAVLSTIGTEEGGRTLELGRNLLSYVLTADLIDLREYDPDGEAEFREWLRSVRRESMDDESGTLIDTHERLPNNWGGMAGASRVAAAVYLGDEQDLDRAATVMRGWLGDRSAYPGIPGPEFGDDDAGKGLDFGGPEVDLTWHADPSRPRGVNPKDARKQGHSIDGALPDDMRRGGEFTWPPIYTQYPREALSGYVALAEILFRQGYDVYEWEDRALLRATRFLFQLERRFPEEEWWEPDIPIYRIINLRYDTSFPQESSGVGRNVGWTWWTHVRS